MHERSDQTRREFLAGASAAALAALTTGKSTQARECGPPVPVPDGPAPRATADAVILLWMAGGMSHTETFDPKCYVPFEPGMDANAVRCTFPAIDTVVDDVKISRGLEQVAGVMDRATLVRSYVSPDLGNVLHDCHSRCWHTGGASVATADAPSIGARIAAALGRLNPAMPARIEIGHDVDAPDLHDPRSARAAGDVDGQQGPVRIGEPARATALVRRLGRSAAAAAFDLAREPRGSLARYDTGRFGRGCLLAGRLAAAGARFVEVSTGYVPFDGWDAHASGHRLAARMKALIDAPVAQLVRDLEADGMLGRTLVVLASEFSRRAAAVGAPDRLTDVSRYGMHRHFTGAGSVLMFGGGVREGFVYGSTADDGPCGAVEDPIGIEDLHATLYRALGITPASVGVAGVPRTEFLRGG